MLAEPEIVGPKIKEKLKVRDIINRIIKLNSGLTQFWTKAEGWAPIKAAGLLNKSRLDWQVSLSKCLKIWIEKEKFKEEDGFLILAWANLGSLVEGNMKLFLSVYYETYKNENDIDFIKKNNRIIDPDILNLGRLRMFFRDGVWEKNTVEKEWDKWILHIQQRRNAIHAYENRKLGSFEEYYIDLHKYLLFIRNLNNRLPYPDDIYKPTEL